MALRKPRMVGGSDGMDVLQYEMLQESAATLARVGRKLQDTLDALAAFDAAPPASADADARDALVRAAGEALWYYVVQREVMRIPPRTRCCASWVFPARCACGWASTGARRTAEHQLLPLHGSTMMRTILTAILLLLAAVVPAAAHPGVGIVMDRQGNVFYTDLVHVWRIAPDGRKSIAVRDVHTHELSVDGAGNLFGEDSEFLGGERWRHRIWRRAPDGRMTDVIPWRDGFFREYGFVHDRAGAMYWATCPERRCSIRKRTPDGRTTTVGAGVRFNHPINWIAAGPQGSVWVVDGEELRRIDGQGRISTVARVGPMMMGLWPDAQGGLYVAVYGNRSIVRVGADGRVATVARTPAPWGPSGVMVAPNGDLWILEYSTSNEARVRRIARSGRVTVF